MNRSLSLVLAAALVAGCAAAHPSVDEEPAATTSDTLVAAIGAAPTEPICTPFAIEDCRINWIDSYGTHHCNASHQVCRADGYAWTKCGDLDAGAPADAAPPAR